MFKMAEKEDIVNELDGLIQKFDVIAAFIFSFFMLKVNLGSIITFLRMMMIQSNNSHAIFAMNSILTLAQLLVVT